MYSSSCIDSVGESEMDAVEIAGVSDLPSINTMLTNQSVA